MKALAIILIANFFLTISGAFAEEAKQMPQRMPAAVQLSAVESRSLFFSLMAIKNSGGKIMMNEHPVTNGRATSYWTEDSLIQCTQSQMKSKSGKAKITYFCGVEE